MADVIWIVVACLGSFLGGVLCGARKLDEPVVLTSKMIKDLSDSLP